MATSAAFSLRVGLRGNRPSGLHRRLPVARAGQLASVPALAPEGPARRSPPPCRTAPGLESADNGLGLVYALRFLEFSCDFERRHGCRQSPQTSFENNQISRIVPRRLRQARGHLSPVAFSPPIRVRQPTPTGSSESPATGLTKGRSTAGRDFTSRPMASARLSDVVRASRPSDLHSNIVADMGCSSCRTIGSFGHTCRNVLEAPANSTEKRRKDLSSLYWSGERA